MPLLFPPERRVEWYRRTLQPPCILVAGAREEEGAMTLTRARRLCEVPR